MDIIFSKKKNYVFAGVLAAVGCCFMVIFPEIALYSAQKGISLWAGSVLPALLPFFICANFLNYIGAVKVIKPTLFPFIMSILSGYPMGAKIIGDMTRDKMISQREAKRLISFCSTSGPTFMIGAVGVGMLGSATAGAIIAASHYIGAILNGVLYTVVLGKEKYIVKTTPRIGQKSLLDLFTDSILSSFKSLAIILAYIVLFMFITDILYMGGFFNFFQQPALKAMVKGFFEMTVGCGALAECQNASLAWKCVLSSMALSWGGLSIIGQSMSMLAGSKISLRYFALTKATHCLLTGIIALILTMCVI